MKRLARWAAVTALAAATVVTPVGTASAEPHDPNIYITATRSGNTAHALSWFQWTGRGQVSSLGLSVYDWLCDSHPTYAYFRVYRNDTFSYWTTGTNRIDFSGCDTGDWTTWTGLSISDTRISYVGLVVCIDTDNNAQYSWNNRASDDCTAGPLSSRNPYA